MTERCRALSPSRKARRSARSTRAGRPGRRSATSSRACRARSEGTFDLPEGTVYPALHRLEDAGLLASSWADADGRRRRVYALTAKGEAALAAGRTEWKRFASGVQAVLGWSA